MDREEQLVGVPERGEIVMSESFHAPELSKCRCRERSERP